MKIVIAEDEFTTRMMIQVCLEEWGYRVESATNGQEAWELLQQPDGAQIAILDWEMPELDGVEVCRRIKEKDADVPLYVILLTGRDSDTDILKGFDAGADDYMTKPFNDNELRARVRVAERLVRTQTMLAESVIELKEALNQLEMLDSKIEVCGQCHDILNPYDGEWQAQKEVFENGTDPRFLTRLCPKCMR